MLIFRSLKIFYADSFSNTQTCDVRSNRERGSSTIKMLLRTQCPIALHFSLAVRRSPRCDASTEKIKIFVKFFYVREKIFFYKKFL
jgi:hypothetical protein